MPFRLTKDHAARVDKAAKHCGQTRQDFLRTTVLNEVAEIEDRVRDQKIHVTTRGSARFDKEPNEADQPPEEPIGLGIKEVIRSKHEAEAPPRHYGSPTTQAPVVITQVGGPAAGGDAMDKLVTYVLGGPEIERSHRRRTALSVLHASAGSDEERKTLTARLDEALATKQRMPSIFSGEGSAVGKVARVAFDKLAGLLK